MDVEVVERDSFQHVGVLVAAPIAAPQPERLIGTQWAVDEDHREVERVGCALTHDQTEVVTRVAFDLKFALLVTAFQLGLDARLVVRRQRLALGKQGSDLFVGQDDGHVGASPRSNSLFQL